MLEDRHGEEGRAFAGRGGRIEALPLLHRLAVGWGKSWGRAPWLITLQMITVIRIFLKVKTGSDRAERLRKRERLSVIQVGSSISLRKIGRLLKGKSGLSSTRLLTVFLLTLFSLSLLISGPFLFSLTPPADLEPGKRKEVFRHVPICILTLLS